MSACEWRIDILTNSAGDRWPAEGSHSCGTHSVDSDKIKSANLGALRSTKQQMVSLEVPFADFRRILQGALFIGESGWHGRVIEASAVALPSIGMETGDGSRHRRVLVRRSPLPSSMRPMLIEICPEIEQLVFQIRRGPEQRTIPILASNRADQPGFRTMAERIRRAGRVRRAHKPATRRSEVSRLGDRWRERLRIRSCCLTRTDSATTERMPPGPESRARVAMTWMKRMTRLRISAS